MNERSALSLDDIREGYQSRIPKRRDDFRDDLRDLKDRYSRLGRLFSKYIFEVAKAAKEEMHQRNAVALKCVESLLDSGWTYKGTGLEDAFRYCFSNPVDDRHESFSDLISAVEVAFADIGNNGPDIRAAFANEIREVQADAQRECVGKLKLYAARRLSIGNNFYGQVGVVQTGDNNSATVTQGRD